MSDPAANQAGGEKTSSFDLDSAVDLTSAILLGVATVLGAFAAYQSSLWGGNQQTAYMQGTNKLGDANRELLKGVQERAFDTTVWVEQMKAEAARAREEAAAQKEAEKEGAAPASAAAEEDDDEPLDAAGLVASLAVADDAPLAAKLKKLMATRRDLLEANKWADTQYERRMKALTKEQMLQLPNKIIDEEKHQQEVVTKQMALLQPLGIDEESDEADIEAALQGNEQIRKQFDELDVQWTQHQKATEAEFDKLSKPMFFESPEYTKKQDRVFNQLTEEGNKLINEGMDANRKRDQFTLTTVLFTVPLFFAGLASTLRRPPVKVAFVLFSLAMLVYSVIQPFRTPFA